MTSTPMTDLRPARVRGPGRGSKPARPASDYSQLLLEVQTAGLMGRRYTYYAIRLACC